MCMWVGGMHMGVGAREGHRRSWIPRAESSGSCEPNMGAGNQTQVLGQSSECSYPLRHLSI